MGWEGPWESLEPDVVYVLETGAYEDRGVAGVFATPEAAMAAWSPKPGAVRGHEYGPTAGEPWSYEWTHEDGSWSFGADWEDAASITPYTVQTDSTTGASGASQEGSPNA